MDSNTIKKRLLSTCLILIIFHLTAGVSTAKDKKWYEVGTLHEASALEWQEATYANKLATCANFIAYFWTENLLNESIQSKISTVDDIKIFAMLMVKQMNDALAKESDEALNRQIYANKKVNQIAIALIVMMGWAKNW